ncbi:MAG: PfkB family carbohydrate kinase [Bacteroidales bacterium]|jgi:fructokinase|nr:PfkB family carbohydrate kinase [Bacteroidales bacterium]
MGKPRIFTFGETVLDILFKNDKVFSSMPGGAMLNTAVNLARLNQEVFLISEAGDDLCGGFILNFLKENRINTDFFTLHNGEKTSIAIASLDKSNEAFYNFYTSKGIKKDREAPNFSANDLLLFGSFYSLREENRSNIVKIVKAAKEAGAIVVYDPNIREAHCPLSEQEYSYLLENIAFSDIIRASNEDIMNVFGIKGSLEVFRQLNELGAKNLFYTFGSIGAWFINEKIDFFSPSKPIIPISSVGAGDTFNAGILFGIAQSIEEESSLENLLAKKALKIMRFAIEMATVVCLSLENYIPENFAKKSINF